MNLEMQQRLTWVLGATCGVLLLVVFALWLGVGRGYGWLDADPSLASPLPDPGRLKKLSFTMPALSHYVEITQRPLFAADRKPIPPDAEDQPGADKAAPAVPLRIALTGVVITPDVKLAMLRDLTNNKSVSLREGMPLPGNQSGWTVVEIHPRKIVVADASHKTTDVELTPPGSAPGAPGQNRAHASAAGGHTPNAAQTPQQRAANDLRARIEARRKELREQAKRLREQRNHKTKPPAEKK